MIRCALGEGPRWDAERGVLAWVDLTAGLLCTAEWAGPARDGGYLDEAVGEVSVRRLGATVGVAVPMAGGWLAAVEGGLVVVGTEVRQGPVLVPDGHRLNDGACDPQGRFWVGGMALDVRVGAGVLFRVEADGSVHVVRRGLTVPNGLGWSPDGRTMYVTDTGRRVIEAHDFDAGSGEIGPPRPFVEVTAGKPDGLCVDEEGGVWTATWTGGRVLRFGPDGTLTAALEVPAARVSACAFAGPERDVLVVTTGAGDEREGSGRLFTFLPGVRGLPEGRFAGRP